MVAAPRLGRKPAVALDLPPLALGRDAPMTVRAAIAAVVDISLVEQGLDLAVGDHGTPRAGYPAHRFAHERLLLHAAAVVREADDVGCQRVEIDQLAAPLLPAGDAAVGNDPHRGVAPDRLQLDGQMLRRIGRRRKIGHRTDGRITAVSSRARSRGDGLLGRKAGFAQVYVHIDQPRQDLHSSERHDLAPFGRQPEPHGRDPVAVDEHVGPHEPSVTPHFGALQQSLHLRT